MLDIGLEGNLEPEWIVESLSFNPSCAGYRSGRRENIITFLQTIIVSILLVLDIGLEENFRNVGNYSSALFQSFLCWI